MSITIDQSFVEQFSSNVRMLAEQRMSRLRNTVMHEQVTGESFAVERLGGIDKANVITNRHGDTPLNNTPHSRRWGFIADYDVADLIDRQDRVRLLIDPDSRYTTRHAGTMGRSIDDTIITALGGAASEGKASTTGTVSFPSAQKIAHGSVGMTVQKMIDAKRILDAAEIDEFIPRYAVMGSQQVADLLEDDKISSQDYNVVKALVRGDVDQFMGFTVIRSERLAVASSIRACYFYSQQAVALGIAREPSSIAADRPDKRHSQQIYTSGSWGAVRVEDVHVVEVSADET